MEPFLEPHSFKMSCKRPEIVISYTVIAKVRLEIKYLAVFKNSENALRAIGFVRRSIMHQWLCDIAMEHMCGKVCIAKADSRREHEYLPFDAALAVAHQRSFIHSPSLGRIHPNPNIPNDLANIIGCVAQIIRTRQVEAITDKAVEILWPIFHARVHDSVSVEMVVRQEESVQRQELVELSRLCLGTIASSVCDADPRQPNMSPTHFLSESDTDNDNDNHRDSFSPPPTSLDVSMFTERSAYDFEPSAFYWTCEQ